MKLKFTALLLAGAMAASSAIAATVSLHKTPFSGANNGGEYLAKTSDMGNFVTFCLESNETFRFGQVYQYVLSDYATKGGSGGGLSPIVDNKDYLSIGSAYLMYKYTTGAYIKSYDTSTAMQQALWMLEGETDADLNNAFFAEAIAQYGAGAYGNSNGAFNIRVMNLFSFDEQQRVTHIQDQIVRVPDAGATIALIGLGLGLIGLVGRRVRR